MEYNAVLDWPYWFDVFILSLIVFVIIGTIVYSFYKDQKDAIKNLKSQFDCYAVSAITAFILMLQFTMMIPWIVSPYGAFIKLLMPH